MIAYCGLDCNECKAFKATQTKDVEWKKRIAKHWSDQSEIDRSIFHVFETRDNGRHAVCLDALTFRQVKDIVDFSSCDLKFKSAPRINEYRCWVLRFASKGKRDAPRYLYTVESPFEGKNLQSLGHAKYLLNFGLKVDLKNPYGSEEINVQEYSTSEKHEKEDGD
jgi:hypothetical protein